VTYTEKQAEIEERITKLCSEVPCKEKMNHYAINHLITLFQK